MEDSARTHREAFNAHANLDLREKIAKQLGYPLQTKHLPLTAGLVNFWTKFKNNNDDEKDVFRPIMSVEQRKNSESLRGERHQ